MTTFTCTKCNKELPVQTSGGTGYGINKRDEKVCYSCCAKLTLGVMLIEGKATLYFCKDKVTDWAGELSFNVLEQRKSKHNFAGVRYDYWFKDRMGSLWHGYTVGNNTEIAHCRRLKGV